MKFIGNRGLILDGRTLFVAFAAAVAALLVWGLVATPAFAQATAKAGGAQATAGDVNLQIVDCSQVQAAVASQYNSGDAGAVAVQYGNGDVTAGIAQALGISQAQVNGCLANSNGDKGVVDSPKGVIKDTESSSKLPDTGGMPLPVAAFALAMVAAGILSAGAIIRRGW